MIKIKKQKEFPFLEEYEKKLPINKDTIFVFGENIYTNNELPYDVVYHELKHIEQQSRIGAKNWIDLYLTDRNFRLEQELEAYKYQLDKVKEINDDNEYFNILTECARNISSELYGNIIKYQRAIKILDEKKNK